MNIGVARERAPGEHRIALGPDSMAKLAKSGATVLVERGAGVARGISGRRARKGGRHDDRRCRVAATPRRTSCSASSRPPSTRAACCARDRCSWRRFPPRAQRRAPRRPRTRRITRARARARAAHHARAVHGRALVAEHRRRLQGGAPRRRRAPQVPADAHHRRRDRSRPRKCFVIGAGVAGLQAIATARRLGGVVSAFDVRAAAAEQVMSLGATFVATDSCRATRRPRAATRKAQARGRARAHARRHRRATSWTRIS